MIISLFYGMGRVKHKFFFKLLKLHSQWSKKDSENILLIKNYKPALMVYVVARDMSSNLLTPNPGQKY